MIFKLGTYNKDSILLEIYFQSINKLSYLIRKKEFAVAAFDLKYKAFIIDITAFSLNLDDKVYHSKKAQIADLKVDKALIKVLSKYADFADIFLSKLAIEIFAHIRINNHAIKLVDD